MEYHAPAWVPALPTDDREFGRVINGDGSRLSWWMEVPNEYDDMRTARKPVALCCWCGRVFEGAISYSGWHMDIHHPGGIYSGAVGPMHIARHTPLPTIPYRCLYSRNIDNLFMAGRNVPFYSNCC